MILSGSQLCSNQQSQNNQTKYTKFLQWFQQNGGYSTDILFPSYFPPTNYIGISAIKQIPANKVILAVPKNIIISVSAAKASNPLFKQITQKYKYFDLQQHDDGDYNILTLFLIIEKMKGQKSFYFSYIQLIELSKPETILDWTDKQIQSLNDPYINNLNFIHSIRKQFEPIYKTFKQISQSQKYQCLFEKQLTKQLFLLYYAAVMTRGFGWGLPETMLVPYADFFNHSSSGVNHYVFDKQLESGFSNQNHQQEIKRQYASQYIKKKYELDLTIFPEIDNKQLLPASYQPNQRELYVESHENELKQLGLSVGIHEKNSKPIRMNPNIINPLYRQLSKSIIDANYDDQLYLSTDSEDNDTESEDEENIESEQDDKGIIIQKSKATSDNIYLKWAYRRVDKQFGQRFAQPKPLINQQFEQNIKFDWWGTSQSDKYFIVSSYKVIQPSEQIYNCYGRRNNRFLLLWYGFCYENNKYDSVPFRVWISQKTRQIVNQSVYTKFLSQIQWLNGIPIGNHRYRIDELSSQFRLKYSSINYKLLAFLRYQYIKQHKQIRDIYKLHQLHINSIVSINMEIQILKTYQYYLSQLLNVFPINLNKQNKQWFQGFDSRQYFKTILQDSNHQILTRHILFLQKLNPFSSEQKISSKPFKETSLPPEVLSEFYKNSFCSSQKEKMLEYKLMVRDYFRLLQKARIFLLSDSPIRKKNSFNLPV